MKRRTVALPRPLAKKHCLLLDMGKQDLPETKQQQQQCLCVLHSD